jgi:hypothetical protein
MHKLGEFYSGAVFIGLALVLFTPNFTKSIQYYLCIYMVQSSPAF